ncbi:hypothetical protein DSL72_003191 [Monilinia vaccinii-corymbosi]|uniref:Expansin-like EG45 domain-containing protein n=1 Tax=Monilinia vaccinii-corymbosi TaxID=61207 RepID=A0A8A3P1M0_9HELO|nr:hypothetical protein DSL72_003191 [Monilinia vaccinii-corymbosi]
MLFSMKTLAFASSILSIAHGTDLEARATRGKASTYGGNTHGGACSFSTYTLPAGVFGTALSSAFWDGSGNCGRCVAITGPKGNTITAMITDLCPGGCSGYNLDLYPNAFTSLGPLSAGILNVSWEYVRCPITTPLQLHNKEGVSKWWFSIQVVNAAEGVSRVDVSTDRGRTWKPTTRKDYNFFENPSGFGTDRVDVKVTGISGSSVIVRNVAVTQNSIFTARGNLGSNESIDDPGDTPDTPPDPTTSTALPSATPTHTPTPAAPPITPGYGYEHAPTPSPTQGSSEPDAGDDECAADDE